MDKKKGGNNRNIKKQKPIKSNMSDYTDLMKKALNTPLPSKTEKKRKVK